MPLSAIFQLYHDDRHFQQYFSYIMATSFSGGTVLVVKKFQQYFSYIMATSFSGGRSRAPGENHRPWASNW